MSSVSSESSDVGAPQEAINEFWENLITKKPAKVTKIFPSSLYAHLLPPQSNPGTVTGKNAAESYEAAAAECCARVKRIVRECHRTNEKFIDPDFDIEGLSDKNCLEGLKFCNPYLINKVCVERDEECGVYGFVFYRDGEWIWTVIDDNLYLRSSDFDTLGDRYDPTNKMETKYKKNHQTGSEALYFASCADENETWLPLLEKAYAKVHGDYDAISGGWSGEAVEDLTGGVTSKILTDRVLSKERLWKELLQINKQFLFSASSPGSYGDDSDARRGLALSHAYSVLKAVDAQGEDSKNHRLVLIRNPWGKRANAAMGEWTGPWSDGSSEWTPYWMKKLDHKFGDDGLFWMSYEDMLKRFDLLDRTRLFDQDWTVVQRWTSVSVAWVTGYLNTKFSVEIKKAGPTVFVLCQLDDRYFRGLEGKYDFDLHFILQEKNCAAGDHIIRARGAWFGNRSISAEIDLEVGTYEVLPKIEASRNADVPDVPEVVTKLAERNPQKLRQIGLNYDIANAKGLFEISEEEQKKKEQKKKNAAEQKKKEKEAEEKEKTDFEAWKKDEKAEFEAWKKDKSKQEILKPKEEPKNSETQIKQADATVTTPTTDSVETKQNTSDPFTVAEGERENVLDLTIRAKNSAAEKGPTKEGVTEPTIEVDKASDNEETHYTPDYEYNYNAPPLHRVPRQPPSVVSGVSNYRPGSVYGDVPAPPPEPCIPVKEEPKSWNAVCVLGLRVYAQDSEVSIKLVKPKDVEEGAILDVDGDTPAGATM
ncbi:cysteine proteinase [Clathrospora elynae]|uniref:Cysteine proteinase n=1 Tax=Clathrospora elynae TaxID=706981 RepID=A0A6A5SIX0_9PLEO|nr:cysteine proteinase [Clathrospora elynae]